MKKISIIIILVSILITMNLYGEETNAGIDEELENKFKQYDFQIGIHASTISGIGFYYLHQFGGYYSFKLGGIYYKDQYDEEEYKYEEDPVKIEKKEVDAAVGIELQRDLLQKRVNSNVSMRFYMLFAGSYWFERNINYYPNTKIEKVTEDQKYITMGVALGYELQFWERVALNVHIGYQYDQHIHPKVENRSAGVGAGVGAGITF